jgi:hypothetical protein
MVVVLRRMKRRAFLRGAGLAGGAALAWPVRRAAAVARPAALDRLRQAKIAIAARLMSAGGEGHVLAELAMGAGLTARRSDRAGGFVLRAAAVAGSPDAVDLFATFHAKPGVPAWHFALALDLQAWSPDHYLLLPGACYAGNRFESRFVGYPPLLTEPADIGPHVPPIVTDIPRLNLHAGPSQLEIAAADLATPAVAVFAPGAQLGVIVLVDPATSIGPTGLTIGESEDRARGTIAVSAPFRRPGRRTSAAAPAPREPSRHAGEPVTLRARVLAFDCVNVGQLNARLFAVRKTLTGVTTRPHTLPFSAAFAAHEARVNARWLPSPGVLAVGARDSAYTTWQTGWCGGLGAIFPLLAAGGDEARARARETIAFVLGGGQSPAGFFHGISDGKTWYDDGFTAPLPPAPVDIWPPRAPPYQHPRWHLVRRSADTLAALIRQLGWLDRRASGAHAAPDPAWVKAARLCADALARLWERHRQFGQFVDVESGDLIVGGSTSAGVAPAALARASLYFQEPRYLEIAEQAARHYFERFVEVGLTCGGPGDALQCPDSESAAGLLESFVTLYETTRDRIWIERARTTAHLLATWVISYDAPPVGPDCEPGVRRATGAVFSDAQNRGGAPGYVLSSGAALFRLYRATGDVAWLELLRDTVHNLAQYLPAAEPPAGARPAAEARHDCPRADTTGWSEATRGVVPTAGLFDAIGLLTYTEVPSVYAQPDSGFLFVFDHLEARVKERLAGRLVLSLRNPTPSDATVRLYAESAAEAALPLGPDAILEAPTAVVPAGSTLEVAVPPLTARR